jgi:glyoxylase-like metal-dependent hydrolase (beta-lactamase superfamily II)
MSDKSYYSIEPARFRLDGGAMFGIIPKPLWNKVHPADEQNRIDLALRLVLIKNGNKNILIDTGIGDYHGDKFDARFDIRGEKSPLEKALALAGLTPADITDLIISHLHFDHVGGIGKLVDNKMEPVLKNATIHLHADHFAYSKNPTKRDEGSFQINYFLPVLEWYKNNNQLHLITGMEGEIFPGMNFLCSMGHTPYLMHAYDDKIIYMADLIPTSNHVHIPWVMGYDIAPGVTVKDKEYFLKFIADKKLTAIYEHDPIFYGSKIIQNEKGEFAVGEKYASNGTSFMPILHF